MAGGWEVCGRSGCNGRVKVADNRRFGDRYYHVGSATYGTCLPRKADAEAIKAADGRITVDGVKLRQVKHGYTEEQHTADLDKVADKRAKAAAKAKAATKGGTA